MEQWLYYVLTMTLCGVTFGLDNGLALTPPRGWMSGQRYECNTDCRNYPDDCLSEHLVRTQTDMLVKGGYKAVGYQYVHISDCWAAMKRDSQGHLVADPKRFPSGIKALADYVHQQGLKLGVFLGLNNKTQHGYPGSQGHLQTDAQTLADWGMDMVTMDAYGISDVHSLDTLFPKFGSYLNQTGRPILYNCRWPMYQINHGPTPNYDLVSKTCNMYKVYSDMEDSWVDLLKLIKYFADEAKHLVNFTGRGSWNDVNQLTVGGYGLSYQQQRMEVALWSILAAPMFISADLTKTSQDSKNLLLNTFGTNISQDQLAMMGFQKLILQSNGQVRVWTRPVLPKGSYAAVFSYGNISGGPAKVTIKLQTMGFTTAGRYEFTDVFTQKSLGLFKPWEYFNTEVDPTGVMFIYAKAIFYPEISS